MAKRKRYNDHILCTMNHNLMPSSSDDPKVQVAFLFCRSYLHCPLEQESIFSSVRDIYSAYVAFVQSLLEDFVVPIPMYQSSAHFCKSFLKRIGNGPGYFSQWGSRKKRDFGMVLDGIHLLSPNAQDLHVLRNQCTKILQNYLQSNSLSNSSSSLCHSKANAKNNARATAKSMEQETVTNSAQGTSKNNVTKTDLLKRVDAAVVNLKELRREVQKFTEPVVGESSSIGTYCRIHMP